MSAKPKQKVTALDETPVQFLKGVGPKLAQRLNKLGISNIADLLLHLPLKYQDRTRVTPIAHLQTGRSAVIEAEVSLTEVAIRRRRMLLCRVADASGALTLRFFTFSAAQQQLLQPGNRIRCFGEVRSGAVTAEMIHPEFSVISAESSQHLPETLTPIYPATEGLAQRKLRSLCETALGLLASKPDELPDALPPRLLEQQQWPNFSDALLVIHQPTPEVSEQALLAFTTPAQQRLAFEELLAHQLALRSIRQQTRQHTARVINTNGDLQQQLLAQLPFSPTAAQQRVNTEIRQDLAQPLPMMRLVQGDVGSGKTLVAGLAAADAVQAGYQVAMMAPTELLAEQHLQAFRNWFEPLGITVAWLAGKSKKAEREAAESAAIVVGTHALFQQAAVFNNLALVIVDEQHRFGVQQRMALAEKGAVQTPEGSLWPHQLIMTATPIPRTLAMSAYADLDISIIDELPPGRQPVQTLAVNAQRRDELLQRVAKACEAGRQAYWVCPLIEESELIDAQAAEATANAIREALPQLRIGLIHGRLKSTAKEQIMRAFKQQDIDLLVATTVIEVGVDVPNATLMVIENSERLGLSQLHQLRGRVGRGSDASHCVLMYKQPLGETARKRLSIMRESTDGFVIAEQDLAIRGPGELLGTRQTGLVGMKIADPERDSELLPIVQQWSDRILHDYPQHAALLQRRWLGSKSDYAQVG